MVLVKKKGPPFIAAKHYNEPHSLSCHVYLYVQFTKNGMIFYLAIHSLKGVVTLACHYSKN
jgi:hypothetical protein